LMIALGSPNLECRQDGGKLDANDRASYIMNTGIANLEKADVVLLIGTNPRHEAPLVNTRLRKAYLANGAQVFNVGAAFDLTFPVTQLGENPQILSDIAGGKHAISKALSEAKNPVIIVGAGAVARNDGASILATAQAIATSCNVVRDGWNGFNLLHNAAARVGALDIGFVPQKGGADMAGIVAAIEAKKIKMVYLLGTDEIDTSYWGDAFVVYQGHHGDIGAHRADVVLPGAAYTEKDALYVNTEGRVQEARRAVFPPGQAQIDWEIVARLAQLLGYTLPYQNQSELRTMLAATLPAFAHIGERTEAAWNSLIKTGKITDEKFDYPIRNFYMSDPISRASKTMASCTEAHVAKQADKVAA